MLKYCSHCRKDVDKYNHRCSNKPMSKNRREVRDKVYGSSEWTNLSLYVRGKYPYCARCGSIDGLSVHHIYKAKDNIEKAMDISNLVPLCAICHSYIDNNCKDGTLDFEWKPLGYEVTIG